MAAILEYTAKAADAGKTVEKILKKNFGVSSKLMTELKLNGKIFINGRICRSIDVVCKDDKICADVSENLSGFGDIAPYRLEVDILYEDDYILVVNKPGGLEVHPSIGNNFETLANAIMYYWSQKGEYHNYHIVNRLDKDTSGLCVIAKNRYAHARLSSQLADKSFKRKYTAVVHGVFNQPKGVIELPIARESESIIKRIVDKTGKYAKTVYSICEDIKGNYSVAVIELMTGRTHQIRVHFSHIGHSLVGDWLYGNGDNERELIGRQALHAGYLVFRHPATQEQMTFAAELPEDMKNLISELSKI